MNKKKLFLILIGLVIIAAGVIVYFTVIKKNSNKEELDYSAAITEKTFKNKKGDKVFKIYTPSNEEINNKARKLIKEVYDDGTYDNDYFICGGNYLGEYNNKLVEWYSEHEEDDKYVIYIANLLEDYTTSYFFIVNSETNELLDLDYNTNKIKNSFEVDGNYYFTEEFIGGTVYDENFKKIADTSIGVTDDNHFYALNDGYVAKYDAKGNIVKKGNIKFDSENSILGSTVFYEDNLYALISLNGIYLYDFNNNQKYRLDDKKTSSVMWFNTTGAGERGAELVLTGNKLIAVLFPVEDNAYTYTYKFDINTKKVEHIGYFIDFDQDKDSNYFYVFNGTEKKNATVYKYNLSGEIVSRASFNADYQMPEHKLGFAYQGNLFLLRWDDKEYYLLEAFTNEKYVICSKDEYNVERVDNSTEGKMNKLVIDLDGNDNIKKEDKTLYFDMISKTFVK